MGQSMEEEGPSKEEERSPSRKRSLPPSLPSIPEETLISMAKRESLVDQGLLEPASTASGSSGPALSMPPFDIFQEIPNKDLSEMEITMFYRAKMQSLEEALSRDLKIYKDKLESSKRARSEPEQ